MRIMEARDDGNDVPGDGIDDVCDPDCTIVDAPEADDHGNDAQTASAIEIGVPIAGQLDAGDDLDYFGFDVEQEATHDIVVTSEAALGCRLEDALANPQDEQSSDPEREGRCEMVARLEADQRYYVIIYVQEGNLTTYSVTITARDEARCGNGVVELGEDCDLGPDVPGDGCDAECRFAARCGNGVVEAGEECDREALTAWIAELLKSSCVATTGSMTAKTVMMVVTTLAMAAMRSVRLRRRQPSVWQCHFGAWRSLRRWREWQQ